MQHDQVVALLQQHGSRRALVGEFAIRLVDHHKARACSAHLPREVQRHHIARRVVGRCKNHQVSMGSGSNQLVALQAIGALVAPHAFDLRLRQRGEERVFAEIRRTGQKRATRATERKQEVVQQFITAIAHADGLARHSMPCGQLVAKIVRQRIRISVERRSGQCGVHRRAHAFGQRTGILVRGKVDVRWREVGIVRLNAC